MVTPGGRSLPTPAYHRRMRDTLTRGRLAEHPLWSRALAAADLHARTILPVVVSSAVEDRERVPEATWLERFSITELVREARAAASAGVSGVLPFGGSHSRDETATLTSDRDSLAPP